MTFSKLSFLGELADYSLFLFYPFMPLWRFFMWRPLFSTCLFFSDLGNLYLARKKMFLSSPKQWHPTPVLLLGKSHGWRSLVGCSPWGREESDTTERLQFHFSLSFIGEGNGNPLQCSCLESLRDGGAWWAAVYAVAQSRTQLKRLSSSSKHHILQIIKDNFNILPYTIWRERNT